MPTQPHQGQSGVGRTIADPSAAHSSSAAVAAFLAQPAARPTSATPPVPPVTSPPAPAPSTPLSISAVNAVNTADAVDEHVRLASERVAATKQAEAINLRTGLAKKQSIASLETAKTLADTQHSEQLAVVEEARKASSAAFIAAKAQETLANEADAALGAAKVKSDKAVVSLKKVLDKETEVTSAFQTAERELEEAKENLVTIDRDILSSEAKLKTLDQLRQAALANIDAKQTVFDVANTTTASPKTERALGWTGMTPAAKLAKATRELEEAKQALQEIDAPDTGKIATTLAAAAEQQRLKSLGGDKLVAAQSTFNAREKTHKSYLATKTRRTTAQTNAEAAHAALVQPATDARTKADELKDIATKAKADFEAARAERDAKTNAKAEAERILNETRQEIAQAEQDDARLKLERETAERDLQQAEQEAARIRALEPPPAPAPIPTPTPTPTPAGAIGPVAALNVNMADNFTAEDATLIIAKFKRELKRPGAWGNNFHGELVDNADQIIIDNRTAAGDEKSARTKIIVNPRVIDFKGTMDDNAIQAALMVAQEMWGDSGIQIKTMNPRLKARILANADHLYQMGKIKKYRAKTLFGTVGEGFKDAKGEVAYPSPTSTRHLGMKLSMHQNRLDNLAHGRDSGTSRFRKWGSGVKRNVLGRGGPAPATATP